MFCILTDIDAGGEIKYNRRMKIWFMRPSNFGLYKYEVDVLNYSDWSIEKVSLNVLMNAIQCGDLLVSDFCNLVASGSLSYRVLNGYLFPFIASSPKFAAKGVTLRRVANCNGVEVEFSDGRCLSICNPYTAKLLMVNYRETINCWNSWDSGYVRALVPSKNGYTFEVLNFQVYLAPSYFTIKYATSFSRFSYVSKADLARRKLMSALV